MNEYQITYHLVNNESMSNIVKHDDPQQLQAELILNLDIGQPVSIKSSFDTIILLPASAIMYFEIKEL